MGWYYYVSVRSFKIYFADKSFKWSDNALWQCEIWNFCILDVSSWTRSGKSWEATLPVTAWRWTVQKTQQATLTCWSITASSTWSYRWLIVHGNRWRNYCWNKKICAVTFCFVHKLTLKHEFCFQNNFAVATKLLKELHKEAKTNRRWLLRWVHSFSRYNHKRSQSQGPVDQISVMLKTIPLLGKQGKWLLYITLGITQLRMVDRCPVLWRKQNKSRSTFGENLNQNCIRFMSGLFSL